MDILLTLSLLEELQHGWQEILKAMKSTVDILMSAKEKNLYGVSSLQELKTSKSTMFTSQTSTSANAITELSLMAQLIALIELLLSEPVHIVKHGIQHLKEGIKLL
ncbi:MAG: hypothetical protein COA94_07740 [Rickettsiales bacterium]|nr:MAG: hypothetical protein COA94_07740 [Rickettsiales bacterium]